MHFLVLAPYWTQDSVISVEGGGFGVDLEESEDPPPEPQEEIIRAMETRTIFFISIIIVDVAK